MTARSFDEIMKSHIPTEKAPIRKYVMKGRFISLWHVRNVINCFGSKECLKRRKYMNRGWIFLRDR